MSLKPYPKYKESGVEWIGEIPEGWEISKFRHLFRESCEKIENTVIGVMLSVSGYRGIEVKEYDDENRKRLDEDLVNYRIVRKGQLVVNTMWLNYAGLGISDYEGHVSPAYRSYWVDPSLDGRFCHYMMRCGKFVQGYTKFLTGIRPNSLQMSRDDLMSFSVLTPPMAVQRAIAVFLDRETAKIDALIAEQESLITLLAEKRQAMISHAVTKGLNPNAKMKDSGVEWLGEVPEHWEIRKLKSFTHFKGGGTPSRENLAYWNGTIPWVSPKDMKVEDIYESEELITEVGLDNSTSNLIETNSVLMVVRSGILQHTIPVAINRVPVSLNQDMKALSFTDSRCLSEFFIRWVQGLNELLLLAWSKQGATVESLEQQYVAETLVPLPPHEEQLSIVSFLKGEIGKFDTLTTEARSVIDLLKERRTALISAAVTGKIDVRGAVEAESAAA